MTTNLYRVAVGKGDRHETMLVAARDSDEARAQLEALGLRVFRLHVAEYAEQKKPEPNVDQVVEKVATRVTEQLRTKEMLFALWAIVAVLILTR